MLVTNYAVEFRCNFRYLDIRPWRLDSGWECVICTAVMHNICCTLHVHSGIYEDMGMWTGL